MYILYGWLINFLVNIVFQSILVNFITLPVIVYDQKIIITVAKWPHVIYLCFDIDSLIRFDGSELIEGILSLPLYVNVLSIFINTVIRNINLYQIVITTSTTLSFFVHSGTFLLSLPKMIYLCRQITNYLCIINLCLNLQ